MWYEEPKFLLAVSSVLTGSSIQGESLHVLLSLAKTQLDLTSKANIETLKHSIKQLPKLKKLELFKDVVTADINDSALNKIKKESFSVYNKLIKNKN